MELNMNIKLSRTSDLSKLMDKTQDSDESSSCDGEEEHGPNSPSGSELKLVLGVLAVKRYLMDVNSKASLDNADANMSPLTDVFDITLTNGKVQFVCVLDRDQNNFVYQHRITTNSIIEVSEISAVYSEKDFVSDEFFPIIRRLNVVENVSLVDIMPKSTKHKVDVNELPWWRLVNKRVRDGLPLTTSRVYYLPLFNDEDYYGKIWNDTNDSDLIYKGSSLPKCITIDDLATYSMTLRKPYPFLLGRVATKSRLTHHGKSTDQNRKCPYIFTIELQDDSGSVAVTFWNSCCFKYFRHLKFDDLILIKKYKIKKRFGERTNTVYNTITAKDIELSVNPDNPRGEVYKVDENALQASCSVNHVPFRFKSRQDLSAVFPDRLICDVTGLVVFIGRYERERKLYNDGSAGNGFWMHRWVHLKDGSHEDVIRVQLYACCHPEVLHNLKLGDILVCLRMLVKCDVKSSKEKRYVYLTTTRESQLYLLKADHSKEHSSGLPFKDEEVYKDLIEWSATDAAQTFCGQYSRTGGYYRFPPLPSTFERYKNDFPVERPPLLVTADALDNIFMEMHYQQRMQLCIQGTVVALEAIGFESIAGKHHSEEANRQGLDAAHSLVNNMDVVNSICKDSFPPQQKRFRKATDHLNKGEEIHYLDTARNIECEQSNDGDLSKTHGINSKDFMEQTLISDGCRNSQVVLQDCMKTVEDRTDDLFANTSSSQSQSQSLCRKRRRDSVRSIIGTPPGSYPSSTQSSSSDGDECVYPYVFLDQNWLKNMESIPLLALNSAHENTLTQSVDKTESNQTEPHFRFVILGRNRKATLNAFYIPVISGHSHRTSTVCRQDISNMFEFMLLTGRLRLGESYEDIKSVLTSAEEFLTGNELNFVLDIYNHGKGETEIIVSRAYSARSK